MIRHARKEDLPDILEIYNDAIINTTAVYTYDPKELEERLQWFETKSIAEEPIWVYVKDHHVVGYATYDSFRDWPAYLYSIEHSIYVDPDYRGQGIASKLLETLIQDAKAKNYRTIVAGIEASNVGSIELQKKFNFTHAGTIKNVGYKFERWLDLAFYQLDLHQ
ncbi:GNAT family N-acetyltransferase [Staphylococcus capitis]|uniref:GNAT family N-acetyltransferase n=1 Tax=Staphylococcus capitis TaxID=29388 RepID=UPI0036782131